MPASSRFSAIQNDYSNLNGDSDTNESAVMTTNLQQEAEIEAKLPLKVVS